MKVYNKKYIIDSLENRTKDELIAMIKRMVSYVESELHNEKEEEE